MQHQEYTTTRGLLSTTKNTVTDAVTEAVMGGGVSSVSDQLDDATCQQLLGPSYDHIQFKKYAVDGLLSKQQLEHRLSLRTDAFLTHDWGGADCMNHLKVSKINAMLQTLGVKTWFDEEQMQGNIKKQMVQGIDNANCVIVFITSRYIQKVASDNAGDNCQLEFNYASLQKTASKMLAVVMEPGMRDPKAWDGEVGMVLGGNLYVDMCGDLEDEAYLQRQCAEIVEAIEQRTGKLLKQFCDETKDILSIASSAVAVSIRPPSTAIVKDTTAVVKDTSDALADQVTAGIVSLDSLSIDDVVQLLKSMNMGAYCDAISANAVDGACLAVSESVDDVKEMGITMNAKAKLFFSKITDFRTTGVPLELIITSPAHDNNHKVMGAPSSSQNVAVSLNGVCRVEIRSAEKSGQDVVHLRQVEVFDIEGMNWALLCNGGKAHQASTHKSDHANSADMLIDGNFTTANHTEHKQNSLCTIDLPRPVNVSRIVLHNVNTEYKGQNRALRFDGATMQLYGVDGKVVHSIAISSAIQKSLFSGPHCFEFRFDGGPISNDGRTISSSHIAGSTVTSEPLNNVCRVEIRSAEKSGQDVVHLRQVEVFDIEGMNWALLSNGGKAHQASSHTEDNSSHLIDGNLMTNNHTAHRKDSLCTIELPKPTRVCRLLLHNVSSYYKGQNKAMRFDGATVRLLGADNEVVHCINISSSVQKGLFDGPRCYEFRFGPPSKGIAHILP